MIEISLGSIITIVSNIFPFVKKYYVKKNINDYNFVRIEDAGDFRWVVYIKSFDLLDTLMILIDGFGETPVFKKINENRINYNNIITFDIPPDYFSDGFNIEVGYTIKKSNKKINPRVRRKINMACAKKQLKLEFKILEEKGS